MKKCPKCGLTKPITEFGLYKSGINKGCVVAYCKPCHVEYMREWRHKTGRDRPLNKNRECALFLGVHVAERILQNEFLSMHRLPLEAPGGDFICGKGYLVDVKSSCLRHPLYGNEYWNFHIRNNNKADYFLCLAMDNRQELNPKHVWLIPGVKINNLSTLSIRNVDTALKNWSKYERPLDKVLSCCEAISQHECGQIHKVV